MKHNLLLSLTRIVLTVLPGLVFLTVACQKEDVPASSTTPPLPTITKFSPTKPEVGTELLIGGINLGKTTIVTVGAEAVLAKVLSANATSVKIQLPRLFTAGPLTLTTSDRQAVLSATNIEPTYPDATVTAWPRGIERTQNIIVKGTNLDMVQELDINGIRIVPNPSSITADQLTVPTTGMTLPNSVVVTISRARGKVKNGTSMAVPVKDYDPNSIPVAERPVVLFDFEDGENPYVAGKKTSQSGINLSKIQAGRGKNFLTVKTDEADGWVSDLGSVSYAKPIDLANFRDPHLTFLINTNGQRGYFQMEIKQNNIRGGGNFTKATSSSPLDDYTFPVTDGWEWRSISLANFPWENTKGDGKLNFDLNGVIQNLTLTFRQSNGNVDGNKKFELNMDQIMITDGKSLPAYTLFTFEDGINPYSGRATSGINTAGIAPVSGNKYLTVKAAGVTKFDWTGDISRNGPFDLSAMKNPHINLWVNTGKNKGYFQIETTQDGTKWGADADNKAYLLDTKGEWVQYNFPLRMLGWGNWSGTGTAFNPKGVLDYVRFGFTTGNVEGTDYEISVDEITISDGPVF